MQHIIAVTNIVEQQEVIKYLKESLRNLYFEDMSVDVVQAGITRIDIIQTVNGVKLVAARYRVLIIPISMSLDTLRGFPRGTNINVNRVLEKLERMKNEVCEFVTRHQIEYRNDKLKNRAFSDAVKNLFD